MDSARTGRPFRTLVACHRSHLIRSGGCPPLARNLGPLRSGPAPGGRPPGGAAGAAWSTAPCRRRCSSRPRPEAAPSCPDPPRSACSLVGVAGGTAITLGVVRLVQHQPLEEVLRGLIALTVAVISIILLGGSGVLPAGAVRGRRVRPGLRRVGAVGRPLAGRPSRAVPDRSCVKERLAFAPCGCGRIFWLVGGGRPPVAHAGRPSASGRTVLIAIAKVSLGWPLTGVAVAVTVAAVRKAVRSDLTGAAIGILTGAAPTSPRLRPVIGALGGLAPGFSTPTQHLRTEATSSQHDCSQFRKEWS